MIILSSSDGRTVRTSRARKRASYRACEGLRDGRGCDVLAAAACAIIEGRPRVWREDERRAHRVERPDRKQSSDLSATPSTPRCSRSSAPKDRARTSVDLRSGGLRCAHPPYGLPCSQGVMTQVWRDSRISAAYPHGSLCECAYRLLLDVRYRKNSSFVRAR